MPTSLPTAGQVHVDGVLTGFAIQYGQDLAKDYVADQATTTIPVKKQSDIYPVWDKGDYYRSEMELRADGDVSRGAGFRVDLTNTYYADVYGLHTYITKRQRANSKNELELEKAKVRYLMGQAKLRRDRLYAAEVFATGLWVANVEQTGVNAGPAANQFLQWDDAASTPILDIQEQMQVVFLSTGKTPNVAVTNDVVLRHLARHAEFVDLIRYSGQIPAVVTAAIIAEVLGLEKLVIGKAIQNTAPENAADVMARVFGNHFLLQYIEDSPSLEVPTAVGGFSWSEFDGVDETGATISQWWDQDHKADKMEAEMAVDYHITANDLGVMMLTATA